MKTIMKLWLVSGLFLTTVALSAQDQNPPEDPSKKMAEEAEAKWHNPDYRPYISAFDDLIKLSDAFAENKLRLALSNYQTGRSLVQKMREDVQRFREEAAEAKHLNEKWYWQTIDRKAREERIVQMKKDKAKMRAVTYFTRAIHHLDEIGNRKVRESEKFKALQADVYRDWIIQQYDLQNIPQTIDITERYIKLEHRWGESFYAHIGEISVEAGQLIKRNEYIARSGRPSSGMPPHLHFSIRVAPYNRFDGWGGFSDPLPYLNPSNILLPDPNNEEGEEEPTFAPHPMAVERLGLRRP